ncbi:hypothetical protein, partial [Bacillus toyonensis]|uniref:hypothetical protein n=1 Tax=Bacillus toyonensis TaxID=155322 RepID=UPI001C3F0D4C
RWLPAIPCPKPIHLPSTHLAFLEEGVFLAKMIKLFKSSSTKEPVSLSVLLHKLLRLFFLA